ncbi:MAG: hypothetical protein K8S98_06460 [Planctomycetes bacterium]|nr:hypothetical protein [Planctomycetota bacterium]
MTRPNERAGRVGLRLVAVVVTLAVVAWLIATRVGSRESAAPSESNTRAPTPSSALAASNDVRESRSSASTGEPAPSATVEQLVPLTVHTRSSMMPNATAVPSVAIEVGVGEGFDPDAPILAKSVTDLNGDAHLTVPWREIDAASARPENRLWIRVAEVGFQLRVRVLKLPSSAAPIDATVIAFPGGTVCGRLSDAAGAPIGGQIVLFGTAADGRRTRETMTEFHGGGWFAANVGREGAFDFVAESDDPIRGGTASLRDFEVRFSVPAQRVDLRLAGAGVLRGHVLDSAGRPATGVSLLAVVAELDDATGSLVLPEPRATELALEGRGRTWRDTQTAVDGAFEFRGLRPDAFHVRARVETGFSGYPILLTPTPVPSEGGGELALVFDRPHIVVRLFDANGSPWTGEAKLLTNRYTDALPSWPAHLQVVVGPTRAEATLDPSLASELPGRVAAGGDYVFECAEGRRYIAGLIGGGQTWRPIEVDVPIGAARVDVALTVEPARPNGVLVVDAHDAAGEAVRTGIELVVEDANTGRPLVRKGLAGFELLPWRIELPEGEYRVAIEGAGVSDSYHGVLELPRAHGRFETSVRIVAGGESKVDGVLPVGARLRVTLHGHTTDADRSAVNERYSADMREELAQQVTVALIAEGRWPESVMFTWELEGSSAAGTHLRSSLALETTQLSEVVSAGRFRVEARLPGGRKIDAPIVLVDGKTTEAELTFE